jgi:hypothetical protein
MLYFPFLMAILPLPYLITSLYPDGVCDVEEDGMGVMVSVCVEGEGGVGFLVPHQN